MTKYKNKKSKNRSAKRALITTVLALVAIAALAAGLETTNVINLYNSHSDESLTQTNEQPTSDIDYSPATSTDNEDINAKKQSGEIDREPAAPTNDTSVQITFIANAQDMNNGPLEIRTLLNGVADGRCNLTLTHGTTVIQKSSSVILQNTSYICEAFIIPYSELESGTWQIKLKVTTEDGRSNEATTSADIN